MRKTTNPLLPFLFFLLFIAHSVVMDMERYLFTNEIFSAIGFLLLLSLLVSKKLLVHKISGAILFILTYSLVSFSFYYQINNSAGSYEKLRTLPIAYSLLCYYFGYIILFHAINGSLFNTLAVPLRGCAALTALIFGGVLAPPAAIALTYFQEKSRQRIYISLIFFIALLAITKGYLFGSGDLSSTIVVMATFAVIMFYFKGPVYLVAQKLRIYHALIFFGIFLVVLKNFNVMFYQYGYDIYVVDLINDANALWRFMFWSKTIGEMSAFELLFGIGLAMPIFNELDPLSAFIIASDPEAEYRPYTLGLHNSLVTFFVRYGVVGFSVVMYVILRVLNSLSLLRDVKSEVLFLSLSFILISSMFNVIWESPLYAGVFWSIVGIASRHCKESETRA